MADTTTQREVEDWIRQNWLPLKLKQEFTKKKIKLTSEGPFEFDAVSNDDTIVVNISTSKHLTSGGKSGSGKLQKIRADIYFLLLLPGTVKRRLMLFTEPDMAELCKQEQQKGRIPEEIEIDCVKLPENLKTKLIDARETASRENVRK